MMPAWLGQLRLLLWKNFMLKRRQPGRGVEVMPPSHAWTALLFVLVACLLLGHAGASAGDRDTDYLICKQRCAADTCGPEWRGTAWRIALGWSCEDDCGYECMHDVTVKRVASHLPVLQYHGKWPFYRLWSVIQEPASVLFSLMNLVANVFGLVWFQRQRASQSYPMLTIYRCHCVLSCNAWLWSAVFHSRDLVWTERLDYFSATAVVLFSAYCSVVRLTLLQRPVGRAVLACAVTCLYLLHIGYLSLIKFDYGYNMAASVGVALVNLFIWLLWCARNAARQPYVWKCAAVLLTTACLMLLELGDFPPLFFAFDAHSLWHLGTSPLPLLWYWFLADDAHFLAAKAS